MKQLLINSFLLLSFLYTSPLQAQDWEELVSPGYSNRNPTVSIMYDKGLHLTFFKPHIGNRQVALALEKGKWVDIGDTAVYQNTQLITVKSGGLYALRALPVTGTNLMKRTGRHWNSIATLLNSPGPANNRSFAIDNKDSIYLFVSITGIGTPGGTIIFLMKWRNNKWAELMRVQSEQYIECADIVMDAEGYPCIAYSQEVGSSYEITVQRYRNGKMEKIGTKVPAYMYPGKTLVVNEAGVLHIFTNTGLYSFSNDKWNLMGPKGNVVGYGYFGGMQMDKHGIPHVAYVDILDGGRVKVKKLNGAAWENIGTLPASKAMRNISLAIDKEGPLYVGCLYSTKSDPLLTDTCEVRVFRYGPAGIEGDDTVCARQSMRLTSESPNGTWSSSDVNVATVDMEGNVSGVSIGAATVSYTIAGNSSIHTVNVKKCPEDSDNIKVRSNASEGTFHITVPSTFPGTTVITITNTLGQTVAKVVADTNTETPVYVGPAPGVYIISAFAFGKTRHAKVGIW